MPAIQSIVYQPRRPDGHPVPFVREPLDTATLVVGHGIEGDRKGNNPKRQLNVMSLETVQGLAAEGFKTGPGELGEQIVISGLVVEDLPSGARIQLGDSAVIEIIDLREPCERFELAQGKSRFIVENRVGVMARVVEGGAIRVGDPVQMVGVTV